MNSVLDYWGCGTASCEDCPSKIDGKKPKGHYGVDFCGTAMKLDLLRRQRELDGRDA